MTPRRTMQQALFYSSEAEHFSQEMTSQGL